MNAISAPRMVQLLSLVIHTMCEAQDIDPDATIITLTDQKDPGVSASITVRLLLQMAKESAELPPQPPHFPPYS